MSMWLAHGSALAQAPQGAPQSPYENLRTLARVLAHVETSYVEVVDQDAALEGAIRGLVASLDPHSSYLDPEEYGLLMNDTAGHFAGVGVEINVFDGWLTVTGVFPGGPAARAGLEVGDRVLEIDGTPARDMPVMEAVRRVRGDPGSVVHLRIRRDAEAPALDFALERGFIQVDAVEAKLLPRGVLLLQLRAFQQTTARELAAAIDSALERMADPQGLRGILLDLRDNPGGLVDQAVEVADAFLREGVIVSTRGRGGVELSEARAHALGTRPGWPMVVLVNGFTASAAEIVAAALHEHGRATLVGEPTFGKGSVQNIIELPDGGALKLTIARYYTPEGVSLQARGIEPDIRVARLPPSVLRDRSVREADLAGHLRAEGGQAVTVQAPRTTPRQGPDASASGRPLAHDNQASVAYDTLLALIAERERAARP